MLEGMLERNRVFRRSSRVSNWDNLHKRIDSDAVLFGFPAMKNTRFLHIPVLFLHIQRKQLLACECVLNNNVLRSTYIIYETVTIREYTVASRSPS